MRGVLDGPDGKSVLFVGSDADDEEAQKKGYYILSACKDGPYGHRKALGYTTLGAPKGPNYLHVARGKRMVLNLLGLDDPAYISEEVIFPGLRFINKHLKAGEKVLIHCNAGKSRGPSMALMFLRTVGELPDNFRIAEKMFKALYPPYEPNEGITIFARRHWHQLKELYARNASR